MNAINPVDALQMLPPRHINESDCCLRYCLCLLAPPSLSFVMGMMRGLHNGVGFPGQAHGGDLHVGLYFICSLQRFLICSVFSFLLTSTNIRFTLATALSLLHESRCNFIVCLYEGMNAVLARYYASMESHDTEKACSACFNIDSSF